MGGGSTPSPATTVVNHHKQPLYPSSVSHFSSNFTDERKNRATMSSNQTNFGPVPSQIEVQNAIYDLRRAMNGFDGIMEQCDYGSSGTVIKSLGKQRLLDAYHLLQTDHAVQRLVVSISSDREVWDAILKNDVVRDLRGSLPLTGTEEVGIGYEQEPNSTSIIVKCIFAVMTSKIFEFMEKLEVFIFKALHSVSNKTRSTSKHDDILEEKVRSSLLLSIVILMIVFVTRSMET
ncbi:hypothetical protein QVD17_27924 [Tagetes erecta]|uniref:Uncharacterized protein n=1 Tax=Tagetes erecta TaxID=13708 RepID=A0AAD8K9K3_TARER|nr:hypothetical protein QVD17_27924 [Tagetes erecta]